MDGTGAYCHVKHDVTLTQADLEDPNRTYAKTLKVQVMFGNDVHFITLKTDQSPLVIDLMLSIQQTLKVYGYFIMDRTSLYHSTILASTLTTALADACVPTNDRGIFFELFHNQLSNSFKDLHTQFNFQGKLDTYRFCDQKTVLGALNVVANHCEESPVVVKKKSRGR
ncbi:hypothetical protein SNEBB_006238 [Seison nebaliae]|nr:hypothetical protein SNEBB_006238 [Seison nebaliae]